MLEMSLRRFAEESKASGQTFAQWMKGAADAYEAIGVEWSEAEYIDLLMTLAEFHASAEHWTAEKFIGLAGQVWAQSTSRLAEKRTRRSNVTG
jgi:hypothetical protein